MMKKLSWVSLVLVAAACGRGFDDPPVNREPLSPCGDLDRVMCGQRSDCRVENLACAAVCIDDGRGGCLPCNAFRCVEATPPACESLSVAQCGARSDCHLEGAVCPAICEDDGRGGCLPCPAQDRCVSGPAACASLDQASCQARPDCRFETAGVPGAQEDRQGAPFYCPPGDAACDPVPGHCIDAPCAALDPNTCRTRRDCRVEPGFGGTPSTGSGFAPCAPDDQACQGDRAQPVAEHCVDATVDCYALDEASCQARSDCRLVQSDCGGPDSSGGAFPPDCGRSRCEPVAPVACEQLDQYTCALMPGCHLEQVACPALCSPDGNCPPCDPICVSGPSSCYGLDAASCTARPDCMLEELAACPDCAPGSSCPPCRSETMCVPARPVDFCSGLDPAVCASVPGCVVQSTGVCPACDPASGVACPPCTTTDVCVMGQPADTCAGLDVAACAARSDCALEELTACPACLPGEACPPCTSQFVCVPAAPPSPCLGLDVAACTADARCEVVTYACTTDCRDDGRGGCLPCEAPPPSCQPRHDEPVIGCGGGGSQPPSP